MQTAHFQPSPGCFAWAVPDLFETTQRGKKMIQKNTLKMMLAATALMVFLPCLAMAEGDADEILATLTEALELTDEQVPQVAGELQKFATDMAAASALAEVEEPDNQAIMGAVKKARNDFRTGMKGVLEQEQFETLETTIDAVFQEMFEDIAEIKLIDLEPVLDLTPEQTEALKPVMGSGMREIIAVVFEYGDKRLTMPRKVKMGKAVKRIQADMDAGVAEILSEEQFAKYTAMKEESKS
jgi:hypothetical protein